MRRFGYIRPITKRGKAYLEASYQPPLELLAKYPNLKKRYTKTMRPEYRPELEAWLYENEQAIKQGIWTPPVRLNRKDLLKDAITLREYAEKYVDEHRKPDGSPLAPTTIAKHREWLDRYIYPTFGSKDIRTIASQDIRDWWDSFGVDTAGNGAVQRFNTYKLLRSIFRHAATTRLDETGRTLIPSTPCTIQPARPRTKHESIVASYKELDILANHMPPYLAVSIYLGGVCGLREGEICALTRKDIDLDSMNVNVDKAVKQVNELGKPRQLIVGDPKSANSVRKVPIPVWLKDTLEEHLIKYVEDEADALIIKAPRTRTVLAPQQLRANWYKALKHVPRLEGMHFHDLRHTALTHYGEAGASLAELMEIAGHSDIKTVTVYQNISREQRERTAERLDSQMQASISSQSVESLEVAKTSVTDPLISVLGNLSVSAQVDVLKSLDKDRQARIIAALPQERQVEVLPLLL